MKKTSLLLFIIIIAITETLHAQDSTIMGLKIGANYSKIKGIDSNYRIGAIADILFLFTYSDRFKLQTELGYSAEGGGIKKSNKKVRFHYINFAPLLFKLYLFDELNLELGPRLSYLMNSQGLDKTNLKLFDYSITSGIGFLISDYVEVGFRYNLGLKNISKTNNSSIKNCNFQAGVSLLF